MEHLKKYEFRSIAREDKATVDRLRSISGEQSSSYSFPVLFCWQEELGLRICIKKDCFMVKYEMAGGQDYFFPCGEIRQVKAMITHLLSTEGKVRFHFVSERNREFLLREYKEKLLITKEDRNSFDYLIKVEDFLSLKGKEYSRIRYYINKIRRERKIRFLVMQPVHLKEVREVGKIWELERNTFDAADEEAEKRALNNYETLKLDGLLFRENGKPVGYIIGTFLNQDTFDIQFMKKLPGKGRIDFYMLYILCRLLKGYASYLNLEDDMGHEGLRQKKLLYRPDEYNKAYICMLTEKEEKVI